MNICRTIPDIRETVAEARQAGRTIALVPTMGALHEGHFSLIRRAGQDGAFVVVSIFVNPTQFAPGEDLEAYPRPLDQDLAACGRLGIGAAFVPSVREMYPRPCWTTIHVEKMTETLCGRSRPGHFQGVCTVVAKLLHIVAPDVAVFGAKDFQQVAVIRRMVADLNIPVEIRTAPTVREDDGLARSSRNAYLDPSQRAQARALYAALQSGAEQIRNNRPPASAVVEHVRREIAANAPDGRIDYVEAVDPETLQPVERTDRPVLLALAVAFDQARLIDNLLVDSTGANF
jgi:pantoate--beta-alanine ligase